VFKRLTEYRFDTRGFISGRSRDFYFKHCLRPDWLSHSGVGGFLCGEGVGGGVGVRSINTLRTGSFKLFKRPFPGILTILTL